MESEQVYLIQCHNMSTTETSTVNSDIQNYVTPREDPGQIAVAVEIGGIKTGLNDTYRRKLESGHQGNFCNAAATSGASVSNRQEKMSVVSIPRFHLDGRIVIIFSDACQTVLKIWGSYANMQNMLKKYGIETHRFDQLKLRTLKSIGAIDIQFKQCSFIVEEDFRQLLVKYDEIYNTDNAKYVQFSHAVDINSHHSATSVQRDQSGKTQDVLRSDNNSSHHTTPLPYKVHVFSIEKQDFISLTEINSLFEAHFERPELLPQILLNLKVAVGKWMSSELQRIEIHSGIEGSLRRLYITRKDFERVLQCTSAILDKDLPRITWVHLGELTTTCETMETVTLNGLNTGLAGSGSCSSTVTTSNIPGNELNNVKVTTSFSISQSTGSELPPSGLCKDVFNVCHVSSEVSPTATETESPTTSEVATASDTRYVIRTLLVDNEVVVCIPDLHKAVIDMYGQSVQVGNYMHRLNISTHRFSRVLLKRLKAHNILSSKATLCTYITKADAARLLSMYSICNQGDDGSDSFHRIVWDEPIVLENASSRGTGDSHRQTGLEQATQSSNQATLKIPLFLINYQIVVSLPDVHKVVQLLNGQRVQLHYNLEKLGIVKHRYSYTEVNQLKVLSDIKRPSLCTYISKTDVDKLLQFYATPENKDKLKLIEWQPPVAVERVVGRMAVESSCSPDIESVNTDSNDDNTVDGDNDNDKTAEGEVAEDYSISDLYKVFVGDDLESIHSINEVDDQPRTSQLSSPLSLPSTPNLSMSQPVQLTTTTPDSRNAGESPRDQLQSTACIAVPSSQCSPIMHLRNPPRRVLNQTAVSVNQKPVDHSGRASGLAPSQTCCPSNNLISTSQTDLPNPMFYSQVMASSNCSCCSITESHHIITARSAITTATSVHSSSASTGSVRQIPSVGSTCFTSFGKLSTKENSIYYFVGYYA